MQALALYLLQNKVGLHSDLLSACVSGCWIIYAHSWYFFEVSALYFKRIPFKVRRLGLMLSFLAWNQSIRFYQESSSPKTTIDSRLSMTKQPNKRVLLSMQALTYLNDSQFIPLRQGFFIFYRISPYNRVAHPEEF